MKVTGTTNNLNFQSRLNISKVQYQRKAWERLADKFYNGNDSSVFDLMSTKYGGIKGQYKSSTNLADAVNFTITPDGVEDLLSKNETRGAFFLNIFEFDLMQLDLGVFNYNNLLKTIDEFSKLKSPLSIIKDDVIERFNCIIASNNDVFERFNKAYKKKGISFDYSPLNYVRKEINNPQEREIRINAVNKRINETTAEINAIKQDIQELDKKSFITRLYNKLTGKENIKETIKNKADRYKELDLLLKVLNDELKYLM